MTTPRVRPRNTVLHHPARAVGASIVTGVAFDLLAFGRPHGPGLTLALPMVTGTAILGAADGGVLDRVSISFGGIACLFTCVPVWRA